MFAISVKSVKTILEIEDTEKDNYIETVLPIIISLVENYCNDMFALRNPDGTYTKGQDGYVLSEAGLIIVIAKIIEFFTHTSGTTQSTVSRISSTFSNSLPQSLITVLNTYRKVKFV